MKRIGGLGLLFLAFLVAKVGSQNQRTILGDIKEQYISQVYDEDVREEKVYRRPPTYLIIASKIVRPSTIYQVSLDFDVSIAFLKVLTIKLFGTALKKIVKIRYVNV